MLLGHKGEGTHVGFGVKELEQTQYSVKVVKGGATTERCLGLGNLRRAGSNFRCPM